MFEDYRKVAYGNILLMFRHAGSTRVLGRPVPPRRCRLVSFRKRVVAKDSAARAKPQ